MLAIRLLLVLLAAYALLVLAMYVFQSRLLHLPGVPGRGHIATPAAIGLDYEPVTLTTADDVDLSAWFVGAPDAAGTVLFFHGNAGNISHRLDSLEIFHALGVNTFIFDYRGYGESEGRPSEAGLHRDARAAYRYLVEQRGIPPQRIVAFGRSLGGALAAYIAARHALAGLILESSFTSVPDLAAELYPWLPARWLTHLRYDTRAHLEATDIPVLVVHSREDEIIGYHHGQALHRAAGRRGELLTLRGDHNTGFLVSGSAYRAGLAGYLDRVLGK